MADLGGAAIPTALVHGSMADLGATVVEACGGFDNCDKHFHRDLG